MNRLPAYSGLFMAVLLAHAALGQQPAHNEVVINNATVMTVTHGNVSNGSVYIKDGKIAAVGRDVHAPATATVVDAGGKYLTPGLIDSHSHIALDEDVNEATSPITPQMMMIDAFDYQDKAIYRVLAGGVTTSLLLHGSANMIGGQAVVIKHKYGLNRYAMLFPGAPGKIRNAFMAAATSCLPPAWAISRFSAKRWSQRRITCASGMTITRK
jgi:imidazolonepropionase-like amidohydrolase